jgi:hypothetical protein
MVLHFIFTILAIFLQILSTSFLSDNKDTQSELAYWSNVISLIAGLVAFVLSFLAYFRNIGRAIMY